MRSLRTLTPIVVLSLLGCGPGQAPPPKPPPPSDVLPVTTSSPEAQELFEKARVQVYAHNEKVAMEDLQKAIQKDPKFALAHLYLARAYDNLDDKDKAEQALEDARNSAYESKASVGEHYLIQAYYYERRQEIESMRAELLQLTRLYPRDKYALYEFGRYYDDFGVAQYDKALEFYEKAIASDPSFAPAYNNAAYIYAEKGDFAKASERIKKFAELDKDNPNAHDSAGELLLWAGKLSESIAEYSEALKKDPSFYFSYIGQGHAYVFSGEFAKAREVYGKAKGAAHNDSEKIQADEWAAISFVYEKKPEDALSALQALYTTAEPLKELPWAAHVKLDRAWILLYSKRLDEAKAEIDAARTWRQSAKLSLQDSTNFTREELFLDGLVSLEKNDLASAATTLATLTGVSDKNKNPREQEYINMLQASIQIARGDVAAATKIIQETAPRNDYIFELQLRESRAKNDTAAIERLNKDIRAWYRSSLNHALVLANLGAAPSSEPASTPTSAP